VPGHEGCSVLLALVYVVGPIPGCHINPAVTLGALLTRRIGIMESAWYWIAQFAGGIVGALVLWWLLSSSPRCHKSIQGRPRTARKRGLGRIAHRRR
jgi:aquaporin Z